MKNRVFQLLTIVILIPLLLACNEDEIVKNNKNSDSAIVIDGGMTTKAVDAVWESGDAIGVTMYNPSYTEVIDGIYNTKYVTTNSGTIGRFDAESEDEILYFPQNGDEIRLKSYYPYQVDLPSNMRVPWSVTDQSVLQNIDLMTAEHLQGFSKYETIVRLHFYHRLCKLIFLMTIEDGSDFVSLEDCQLTIRGAETGNMYDLLNDRFLNFSTGEGDITVPLRDGEDAGYREAILLPRAAGEGLVFELETPEGDTYIANMTETLALEGGNQYTFVLQLQRTPITVSATIEPWTVNDPITYQTLVVSTPAGPSEGVNIGDVMNVYLQGDTPDEFNFLRRFTYESVNNWVPEAPVYWEDIEADPATFRASIIAEQALNTTQLPDILIADELSVARHTGADFVFRHVTSKVIIGLSSTTFSANDLLDATIVLPDYLTGGYEENGQFIPGTERFNILVDRDNLGTGTALFQPQTIAAANPLLTVTINGRDYSAYDEDGFTFEAGVAYQILVIIEKEEITVSVTVIDWVDQDLTLRAVHLGTRVNASTGVQNGEELNVYTGDDTNRTLLNDYTYNAALDTFVSQNIIYWESLANPTTFYGTILREPAYNDTQIDDYLVATPIEVYANDAVQLQMEHAGARVIVQLTSLDGTFSDDQLAAMNLVLPDYITGGTMDDAIFIPGTTRGNITVAKNVGDNNDSAIAFIDPQTIPAGTTVIDVISPTITYSAIYPDDVVFGKNVSTTLYVDLSETAVSFSVVVTDWTEQTISMVAPSLAVGGKLDETSDFFRNKTISVYKLGNDPQTWEYVYQNPSGTGYEWIGPTIYWDDQPGQTLSLTGIYYPTQQQPTITNNTFPWVIAANQNEPANNYYDNYDLLTDHLDLSSPQYVNFNFTHATSLVEINLEPGTGFIASELVGATVVLPGYNLSGTVDITTGTIGSVTNPQNVTPRTDTDGVLYTALVMPQTKPADSNIISVTIPEYPNTPFIGTLDTNLEFRPGQKTIINVRLNKTEIELSARLAPWVDGDTGNIIIE